jgi:glutamate:GABA antiporter
VIPSNKRVLSVFSLVMMNVIAVDSLRTLAITAQLGFSLVFYYLIAAITFFIPVALVAAELATAYPNTGGIYIWVREAFGVRAAFITSWMQWIYNVVWYPTMLAFIAATLAYLFAPELANNRFYLFGTIIVLFWIFTCLNCFGMKISSLISVIGASVGTLLPMIGIIILSIFWVCSGHHLPKHPSTPWIPTAHDLGQLPIFVAVLFGLLGMEMSAIHAEEVKNPQRDYPRALLYSTILIFSTLTFGSLAIVMVVPLEKLSVVSGFIEAYSIFFDVFKLSWMTPIIAGLVIIGGLSSVSAWIIGPTRSLLISAHDGCLPKKFTHVNRHGAPVMILIAQGVLFTILSSVFYFIKSVNEAYWLLSVMCGQLALLVYVFMFAAAIKLRYSKPEKHRAYKIPGGKIGMCIVAGIGLFCCVVTILIGFIPPTQIPMQNIAFFEISLILGLVIFVMIPWIMAKKAK